MSVEEIKGLGRRVFEEMSKGKEAAMAVIDECYASNVVVYGASGLVFHGLKDFKQYISEFYNAFPDFHFTIDDMVVEGDKVAIRETITGTHKGAFMGIPPTNKKVTIWALEIDRVAGGKIVEARGRFDTLGLMQQLGVVPTPGKQK
jgi:predicted ester cyclase